MISDDESRMNFVEKAVEFIEKYSFDGISIEWQYPVCWQADCSKGPESDKENFAKLLKVI